MPGAGSSPSISATALIERQIRRWDRTAAILKRVATEGESLAEVSRRPVLTVSGSMGSGRERLCVALCKELNYELYGRELMDSVATDLNCQRMLLESLDERAKSSIEILFSSWLRDRQIEKEDYLRSLFRVMNSLAEKGGVILLGRGGAFILGDKAALRVRVEAPVKNRIQRVMDGWNLDEKAARELVATRDREQGEFLRHFFRRPIDDPLAYDMILNTERLDPAELVPVILTALDQRGIHIDRAPERAPAPVVHV